MPLFADLLASRMPIGNVHIPVRWFEECEVNLWNHWLIYCSLADPHDLADFIPRVSLDARRDDRTLGVWRA